MFYEIYSKNHGLTSLMTYMCPLLNVIHRWFHALFAGILDPRWTRMNWKLRYFNSSGQEVDFENFEYYIVENFEYYIVWLFRVRFMIKSSSILRDYFLEGSKAFICLYLGEYRYEANKKVSYDLKWPYMARGKSFRQNLKIRIFRCKHRRAFFW